MKNVPSRESGQKIFLRLAVTFPDIYLLLTYKMIKIWKPRFEFSDSSFLSHFSAGEGNRCVSAEFLRLHSCKEIASLLIMAINIMLRI